MAESLVRLGHSVGIFLLLERGTGILVCIKEFGTELLRHRFAAAASSGRNQPAHRKGFPAIFSNLDRHEVSMAMKSLSGAFLDQKWHFFSWLFGLAIDRIKKRLGLKEGNREL